MRLRVRGEKKDTERGVYDFPTIPLADDALTLKYDGRIELVRVLYVAYSSNGSRQAPTEMTLVVEHVAWAN
jgi:hypothetical protein